MRILVLGGSGFLGSHIVDKFLCEKHDVTVYDLYPERFRRSPSGIKFVTGDFGNVGALDELIATGFDAVIHCVSTTTPKSSNESPEFDMQSNVIGTLYLLDICAKRNIGKLCFCLRVEPSTGISEIWTWSTKPIPCGPCARMGCRS